MDRNSYIGLGLIFMLLIGYFVINRPSEQDLAIQKRMSDSLENVRKNSEMIAEQMRAASTRKQDSINQLLLSDSSKLVSKFGGYAAQVKGDEKTYTIENEDVKITISNKGADIHQVELKKYKTDSRKPVLLLDEKFRSNHLSYLDKGNEIKSSDFYWEANQIDAKTIHFKLYAGQGSFVEYRYKLSDKGYNLAHDINSNGIAAKEFKYHWESDINLQERDIEEEKKKTTVYFKYPEESADYINETKNEELKLEQDANWVSFKQQFFNTTISTKEPFKKGSVVTTADPISKTNVKHMKAVLDLPGKDGDRQSFQLNYFFGPNQYDVLKAQNIGLDKIIPLGWGIFGWINRFMIIPIFNFLQSFLSNYGIIILLLTLIIKTLLLPLVFKSYKSGAKMKLLKPEMDAIKEKYKDDAQKVQLENLALYRKAGVNPLGGCLPMLLQMPILVAVFQFVPSAFEFRQQAFLWADDLSIYDSIWTFGKLPIINTIYGDHVSLFTLLMTISTLIYTKMNNEMSAGMNEQMKYVSYIMPILFLGFFNKYAAALTYYYFLSNVVTFTQQFVIRKFVDENKLKQQIHDAKNRKGDDKPAFQKRLEEMAKARGVDMNKKK